MNLKVLLSAVFIISSYSLVYASDRASVLNALKNRDFTKKFNPQATGNNSSTAVDRSAAPRPDRIVSLQTSCTREEQTSLPQSFLESLILKEEGKLIPKHDPETGVFEVDAGKMIGNCNSMLSAFLEKPSNGRGYLFSVGVKKPAAKCNSDPNTGKLLCEYKVTVANDGVAEKEPKTIMVEPNYYGYIECLKETEVLTDDGINASKIASTKFLHIEPDAYQGGDLWYFCNGPECEIQKKGKNLKVENSCRHYEPIKGSDGKMYTAFTQDEIEYQNLEKEFDSICNSGNYLLIEKRLPKFGEIAWMQDILLKVRDIILEKEVKELHLDLQRKDYSKLSSERFNKVMGDFHKKIILPKKNKILKLVQEIENMRDGKSKKRAKARLNKLIEELRKYSFAPFVSSDDYEKMQEFARKAPLDEKDWRDAALHAYAIANTAFHVSRYHPDFINDEAYEIEDATAAEVNRFIKDNVKEQKVHMEKLGKLASDKDGKVSFSKKYEKTAENIMISHANDVKSFQEEQFFRELGYNQMVQSGQCPPLHIAAQNNPYLYRFECADALISLQQVSADVQDMKDPAYLQSMYSEIGTYREMSHEWALIEAERNKAYGIDPRSRASNLKHANAYRKPTYEQYMIELQRRMQQQSQRYDSFQRSPYPVNPNNEFLMHSYSNTLRRNSWDNPQGFSLYQNNSLRAPATIPLVPGLAGQGSWQLQSSFR